MFCPKCGHTNAEAAKFCEKCGTKLELPATPPPVPQAPEPIPFEEPAPVPFARSAPPPLPAAAPASTPPPLPGEKPTGKKTLVIIGGVTAALFMILLLVTLVLPGLSRGGSKLIVAEIGRSGEYDLYLVDRPGQDLDKAQLLVEEVTFGDAWFGHYDRKTNNYSSVGNQASFMQSRNFLLYQYEDRNDTLIAYQKVSSKSATELLEIDANAYASVISFNGSNHIGIRENDGGSSYCYFSDNGNEAERQVKGDFCWFTPNGKLAYAYTVESNGIYVTFSDSKDEIELEDAYESPRFSDDGKYIAYKEAGRNDTLYIVTRRNQKVEEIADGDYISEFSFIPNSNVLYAIIVDGNDTLLYTSNSDDPIAEGDAITAQPAPNGDVLIYKVTDDDGESTIYALNVSSHRSREIINDDDLSFAISPFHDQLLIRQWEGEGEDLTLYQASLDGKNLVELVSIDEVYRLSISNSYDSHITMTILEVTNDEGSALYTFKPGSKTATLIFEEWAGIDGMDFNDSVFIFDGREDSNDDWILYSVALKENAEPVELDDDEEYTGAAVLSANGRTMVYTKVTGDDDDDYEVREVAINGKRDYDTLYDQATLLNVQWRNLVTSTDLWWR